VICHKIGKVREYAFEGFIDFSDEGRLLGYTAMGYAIVKNVIEDIAGFPEELSKKLLHLVLSQQSINEKSGILPMTLEAVVLQYLILLDANTNALCRITANDALPDSRWSKYIPLLDRFVYVGKQPKRTGNQDS
jgi:23S rRNA maturation-related 3'-5' exoribonuclease YhaM